MRKQKDNSHYVIGAQILALVVLVAGNWWFYTFMTTRAEQRYAYMRTRKDSNIIATAMQAYCAAYGNLPLSDKAQIMAADFFSSGVAFNALPPEEIANFERLLNGEDVDGKNPQKLQFLNFTPTAEQTNFIEDAWGTLYQIKYVGQTNFIIQSAGNNTKFGDKDDLIYSSQLSGFMKH